MNFRAEKQLMYQEMVRSGSSVDAACARQGIFVPEEIKEMWKRQAERVTVPERGKYRLVNRFFIGADPEFVIATANGGYIYGEAAGLDTLKAFGCDMSGRQAELRAAPSRSVLKVIASIYHELQWMNAYLDAGRDACQWVAPATFAERDGIGGHIHFGRRRPRRAHEIRNLDTATDLLLQAGVLDKVGQKLRAAGHYGHFGDYRLQPHGYEYRTPPTWLCSPEVAFLTLTVAKLTLLHPAFQTCERTAKSQLINLLAEYKAFDDDAALAFNFIKKVGFPVHSNENFKPKWGIGKVTATGLRANRTRFFIPETIQGSDAHIDAIYTYLTANRNIPMIETRDANWTPYELGNKVWNVGVTFHAAGIPETAAGLLSREVPVQVSCAGTRDLVIAANTRLSGHQIKQEIKKQLASPNVEVNFEYDSKAEGISIALPHAIAQDWVPNKKVCTALRNVISNPNLFPICKGLKFNQTKWPEAYVSEKAVKLIGRKIT